MTAGAHEVGRGAARPYPVTVMVSSLPDRAEAIRDVLQRDMVRAALEQRPMAGLVISAFVNKPGEAG